ncbi:MAG: SsrA-binding protein SmpB [Acidobacteriota bacterium]|jgi:SsrA-binding protein
MAEFEKALASNRRATHDYHILERFEAGIVLTGTEVKSARGGRVTLKDGHGRIKGEELWLVGVHIAPYSHGNVHNHEPERPRKLLLHKRQIQKLFGEIVRGGRTLIPLRVYLKGSRIKVELGLATGKKKHDKREAKRTKQMDREARASLSPRRDR